MADEGWTKLTGKQPLPRVPGPRGIDGRLRSAKGGGVPRQSGGQKRKQTGRKRRTSPNKPLPRGRNGFRGRTGGGSRWVLALLSKAQRWVRQGIASPFDFARPSFTVTHKWRNPLKPGGSMFRLQSRNPRRTQGYSRNHGYKGVTKRGKTGLAGR